MSTPLNALNDLSRQPERRSPIGAGIAGWMDHWMFTEYELPAKSLGIYRIIFAGMLLALNFPRWLWISSFDNSFYRPAIGIMIFSPGLPPAWLLYLLNLLGIAFTLFLLFGRYTRIVSIGVALTMLIGNSFDYSFGLIAHDIFLIIVPMVMAFSRWGDSFSLDALYQKPPLRKDGGWPLAMLALLLGSAMMYTTIGKIRGGWLDLHRHAVYQYMLVSYYQSARQNAVAAFALNHTPMWLWKLQDLLTILLEGGFLFAALRLRMFRFAIAIACLFHLVIGAFF
jgi:uncharacterized membrane protein YphA (DoxX/SURF4 family)